MEIIINERTYIVENIEEVKGVLGHANECYKNKLITRCVECKLFTLCHNAEILKSKKFACYE